jgi:hypothetical protein
MKVMKGKHHTVADVKKLTQEELDMIQQMNSDFTKAKISLGDLELEKYALLQRIEHLKMAFAENEKLLIVKYGENSVINIKTGEVTEKKD